MNKKQLKTLDNLKVEHTLVTKETIELLKKEFNLDEIKTKEEFTKLRNKVVLHYSSKSNPNIDFGRLSLDDMTRMSMVTAVIDSYIYGRRG